MCNGFPQPLGSHQSAASTTDGGACDALVEKGEKEKKKNYNKGKEKPVKLPLPSCDPKMTGESRQALIDDD